MSDEKPTEKEQMRMKIYCDVYAAGVRNRGCEYVARRCAEEALKDFDRKFPPENS